MTPDEPKYLLEGKRYTMRQLARIAGLGLIDFELRAKRLGIQRAVGKIYTFRGTTRSLIHWSRIKGIPLTTLRGRFQNGIRGEKLFAKRNYKKDKRRNREGMTDQQRAILRSFDGFTHY